MPAARQCSSFSFAGTTGGGEEPRDLELYTADVNKLSRLLCLVWSGEAEIPVFLYLGKLAMQVASLQGPEWMPNREPRSRETRRSGPGSTWSLGPGVGRPFGVVLRTM